LKELQIIRNNADYKFEIGKKLAKKQLEQAKQLIEIIFKVIE
jgi:hypothetical protein